MFPPIFAIILSFIAGLVVQYYYHSYWGLAIAFATIMIFHIINRVKLYKIKNWVNNLDKTPPIYMGYLEPIISPLFRHFKKLTHEKANLMSLNRDIMEAANAFPAGVIILNSDYTIQWCNRNAFNLIGIDSRRDIGTSIFNILRSPDFYKYVVSGIWTKPYLTYVHKNEQTYNLKYELTKYHNGGILVLCFDNTALDRMKTTQQDFVANVSHEIKTPLTVLIGFLETLGSLPDSLTTEQKEHFHELMQEQAHRMQAIITDLLALSELESSKLDYSVQPEVKVSALLEQAKRSIEMLSGGHHKITWNVDKNLTIRGKQTELGSAFTNILTNAVRYTPEGGSIEVFWGLNDKNNPVFSVKDSGLGISPTDISRITERFYRVDKSRSRASGGTGLGLAITKHVALRHQAKLLIESKLNQGSTFSLIFPVQNFENEDENIIEL